MSDDFNPIEWITTVAGVQVGKFRSNHRLGSEFQADGACTKWG
jgi:hypothetical protein